MRHATLISRTLPGASSRTRDIGLVLLGSVLVAASAQVTVPMQPVPMTLQTMAISLIGLTCGARVAGLSLLAYLLEGALGAPVFAGGTGGVLQFFGPTGGFLLGFPLMAWATGWLVERGFDRGVARLFGAAFLPSIVLFVPGVLWLSMVTPLNLHQAIMLGAWPFQIGGVVKSLLAATIVAGVWRVIPEQPR